jgi:hypothetical protein
MEHPQHSNRSISPNMPNITEIFMDDMEDIKSFKLGPIANIYLSEYAKHHRDFYGPCGGHQELQIGTKCEYF